MATDTHSIEQPIIHLSDIMQETASDVAPADEPGEEEMTFEIQLPPREVQQAKFQAHTSSVAPLSAAPSAADVAKKDYF